MNGEMAAPHANARSVCTLCARKCPHSWSGRQLEAIANALCIVIALERGTACSSFLTIIITTVTIRFVLLTPLFWQLCRYTHSMRLHCNKTVCTSACLRGCIHQAAQGPSFLGLFSRHSCGPLPSHCRPSLVLGCRAPPMGTGSSGLVSLRLAAH